MSSAVHPTAHAPVSSETSPSKSTERVPAPSVPADIDRSIQVLLDTSAEPGETINGAFQRKEQALRVLFADLPSAQASTLHRRLSNPTTGDMVAQRFLRLDVNRRDRLLAFLRDARRREAIAVARAAGGRG